MKAKKIEIVFSFSNPNVVPATMHWKSPNNGIYAKGNETPILSGEKVSVKYIFDQLQENGLVIQGAFAEKRMNESRKYYTSVKFSFQNGKSKPVIAEKMIRASFEKIAGEAFWNFKIYKHEDKSLTVACFFRTAIYQNGELIRVWDRDLTTEEKIGNEPRLMRPKGTLHFSKKEGFKLV